MSLESEKSQLIAEFPELGEPDVYLTKEVYAHFGLVFFGFSLVEHSMINIFTFHSALKCCLSKKVRTQAGWQTTVDSQFEIAKSQTMGNLIKYVLNIKHFAHLKLDFEELKKIRDYATHHFFRDEVGYFGSDEGCWLLLTKLATARRKIAELENAIKPCFERICSESGIQLPDEGFITKTRQQEYSQARERVMSGAGKVGWE